MHAEPIETASIDVLARAAACAACATLFAAPMIRFLTINPASTKPASTPTISAVWKTSASFPLTAKEDLRQNYPVRHVRGPDGADRPHPCLQRHHRQAHGLRLHQERHRHLVAAHGAFDPRRRRSRVGQDPRRLRLRAVHRRPGRALRRRISRRGGHSGQRRVHRAAGADHQRLQARHHHGHAVVHAGHRRRIRPAGPQRARLQPAPGHFRRRTLGRGHARRTRTPPGAGGARRLWPVGGHGTGRRAGMRRLRRAR